MKTIAIITGVFIIIFGIMFSSSVGYAEDKYIPAPYAGPPEGSGGFFNIIGSWQQGSKNAASAPSYIPVQGVISKVEGGGAGFCIVRIDDEGEEIMVYEFDSSADAEGKKLSPGVYKIYPNMSSDNPDGLRGRTVRVDIYVVADQPENVLDIPERE